MASRTCILTFFGSPYPGRLWRADLHQIDDPRHKALERVVVVFWVVSRHPWRVRVLQIERRSKWLQLLFSHPFIDRTLNSNDSETRTCWQAWTYPDASTAVDDEHYVEIGGALRRHLLWRHAQE